MRLSLLLSFLPAVLSGSAFFEAASLVGWEPPKAAAELQRWIAADPERAAREGWWYLLGQLEARQGRWDSAIEALERAMDRTPELRSRAELLRIECLVEKGERTGAWNALHRALEDAAWPTELRDRVLGKTAQLSVWLKRDLPPRRWVGSREGERWWQWAELLQEATRPLPDSPKRLDAFLRADPGDPLSLEAARAWERAVWQEGDPLRLALFGRVFFAHRELHDAAVWLDRAQQLLSSVRSPGEDLWELGYLAARAYFFAGDYREAARRFQALFKKAGLASRRADAAHQWARSLEFLGEKEAALQAFFVAWNSDPSGSWAGASILARVRLAQQLKRPLLVQAELERLFSQPRFRGLAARTALGLAAIELCGGRSANVRGWLGKARSSGANPSEVAYWLGRLEELETRSAAAVPHYVNAATSGDWSPWGKAAVERFDQGNLWNWVTEELERRWQRASAEEVAFVTRYWVPRAKEPARRWLQRAAELRAALGRQEDGRPFLEPSRERLVPGPGWSPEERLLLSLGWVGELSEIRLEKEFRSAPPALHLELARELAWSGAYRRSIRWAERALRRRPKGLPLEWVDRRVLELLYPNPFRGQLERAAKSFGVEQELLAALVREESRFDPAARSPVGALGLGQFLFPVARAVAERHALPPPTLQDLKEPKASLRLTAAHLAELSARFGGRVELVLSAYNAGVAQTQAWLNGHGCSDPWAFASAVPFQETRAYIQGILSSRMAYHFLADR